MPYIVEEENFLEAAFGNFLDRIKNSVYKLQKYIDEFKPAMEAVTADYKTTKSQKTKDLIKFIILEAENIVQYKAIHFSVETDQILQRKYESLLDSIEADNGKHKFLISVDAYLYLDYYLNEIDWAHITSTQYKKKTENKNELLDFIGYMTSEFQVYHKLNFEISDTPLSKDELITVLNGAFMRLSTVMLQLKEMMETSSSMFTRALIARKIITIMIITYTVCTTIQFA